MYLCLLAIFHCKQVVILLFKKQLHISTLYLNGKLLLFFVCTHQVFIPAIYSKNTTMYFSTPALYIFASYISNHFQCKKMYNSFAFCLHQQVLFYTAYVLHSHLLIMIHPCIIILVGIPKPM